MGRLLLFPRPIYLIGPSSTGPRLTVAFDPPVLILREANLIFTLFRAAINAELKKRKTKNLKLRKAHRE